MEGLIERGGVFMWPLLFSSALALAVGVERAVYFLRMRGFDRASRKSLENALAAGELEKAIALAHGPGPSRDCVRAAVENWSQPADVLEAALAVQAKEHEPLLNRFLGLLETIVTAAPLVGLLGTITGMMGVFRSVAQKLSADPHASTTGITAGIGEALIATATGILVAVAALLIHNVFQAQAEARMTELEQTAESIRLAHAKKGSTV